VHELKRPPRLTPGSCIGIFTPSAPFHVSPFAEKFRHGVAMLERAGFRIKLGSVTASGKSQGYRSASPIERAAEVNELFADPDVMGLMATIGGSNTSSIVDLLDYDLIAAHPKVVCGYSDVTSLHCALTTRARLSSFYGPAVFPSFGEWPEPPAEMLESFLDAVSRPWQGPRVIERPKRWSRHWRDATNGAWRSEPRQWEYSEGWNVVREGYCVGRLFACNLSTLLTHAGTNTFPNFEASVLVMEAMAAPLATIERSLVHLARLGVLSSVKAVMWGRVETPDPDARSGDYEALLEEFVPPHVPLVTDVDCSHTVPMLTLSQGMRVRLEAPHGSRATLTVLEPMVID